MSGAGVARAGDLALAGVLAFLLAGIALHGIRTDLDWVEAQMSLYLVGTGGRLLQAGYCAMAGALVLLSVGLHRTLAPPARSGAPVLLFSLGALGLCVTAFAYMDLEGAGPTFIGWVHGVSAYTAFLCVTTAMLLQSWRLRDDPRWRRRSAPALVLAVVSFGGVWMLALLPELPRGLAQKAVILAIGAWVLLMVQWLRRAGDRVES